MNSSYIEIENKCRMEESIEWKNEAFFKWTVYFSEPEGGRLDYTKLFSSFLCHFSSDYKLFLWQTFEGGVPFFDN